jgi:hypothetical protein
MMPATKRVGSTVFGVRSGCHAFKRCCLKAVSLNQDDGCQYTKISSECCTTNAIDTHWKVCGSYALSCRFTLVL